METFQKNGIAGNLEVGIRNWIRFFIVALILSGVTAFPIESELQWVLLWWPETTSPFYLWLNKCYTAISAANSQYPFLAYGYDWLAFAHIVIAIAFIGPLKDPVRNVWIIQFGMIACILILPLAFIAGHVRGIPMFWRLLDCSFGVFGLIPLKIVLNKIRKLEIIQQHTVYSITEMRVPSNVQRSKLHTNYN